MCILTCSKAGPGGEAAAVGTGFGGCEANPVDAIPVRSAVHQTVILWGVLVVEEVAQVRAATRAHCLGPGAFPVANSARDGRSKRRPASATVAPILLAEQRLSAACTAKDAAVDIPASVDRVLCSSLEANSLKERFRLWRLQRTTSGKRGTIVFLYFLYVFCFLCFLCACLLGAGNNIVLAADSHHRQAQ